MKVKDVIEMLDDVESYFRITFHCITQDEAGTAEFPKSVDYKIGYEHSSSFIVPWYQVLELNVKSIYADNIEYEPGVCVEVEERILTNIVKEQ